MMFWTNRKELSQLQKLCKAQREEISRLNGELLEATNDLLFYKKRASQRYARLAKVIEVARNDDIEGGS